MRAASSGGWPEMRLIIGWCLGNRPVVLLFTLIAMGAGLVSVFRLNQEFLPSVAFPTVFILTTEPGAGPEVVDRDVTQPTVSNLEGLTDLKHVISTSSQGFSEPRTRAFAGSCCPPAGPPWQGRWRTGCAQPAGARGGAAPRRGAVEQRDRGPAVHHAETAEHHVTSILGKLGLRTRAEVAAWAAVRRTRSPADAGLDT